jgi:hypothetical protein
MLNIQQTFAMMGKIANNLEKHGEEDVTAFEVPLEAITLTREQFNALIEDPYADRWLFTDKADMREPNLVKFKPLELVDTFEEALVSMTFGETAYLFHDCRIKGVTFEGKRGGDIMLAMSVRIRPENPEQILALIDYQNHEIRIDVQDAKIVLKGGRKQQELALSQPVDDASSDEEKPEVLTHPSQLFEKPAKGKGKKRGESRAH